MSTLTDLTITCNVIPVFGIAFKSLKIFSSLDIKRKGVPDLYRDTLINLPPFVYI